MKTSSFPRKLLKQPLAALLCTLCATILFSTSAAAQSSDELRDSLDKTIPDAKKEIVKLTDSGPVPASITISQLDSSVFFLNTTTDALVTLEVDFGKHRVHCWSPNLEVNEEGLMRTTKPIAPKDFAIMCFPQRGTYSFVAKGLSDKPEGISGEVIIK